MPAAYRLTLHPAHLPPFTTLSTVAWPTPGTVVSIGPREASIHHAPDGGAPQVLVLSRSAADAIATPPMPKVSYVPLAADGWEIFVLGGRAWGVVVGWWVGEGTPVPPAGGTVEARLGGDLFAALREFADPVAPGT